MWRFDIEHQPGKDNYFSDVTSRHPALHYREDSSTLCCICIGEKEGEDMEADLTRIAAISSGDIRCITWDLVKQQSL